MRPGLDAFVPLRDTGPLLTGTTHVVLARPITPVWNWRRRS
jgi:hypothetical protein